MSAGSKLEAAASGSNIVRKHASVIPFSTALTTALLKDVEKGHCHEGFAKEHVSLLGRSRVLTSYVGIDAGIMRCLQHITPSI